MAKLSAFPSRAAALDEDGQLDDYLRPEEASTPRSRRKIPRVDEAFADTFADTDDVSALPRPRRRVAVRKGFSVAAFARTRAGRIMAAALGLAVLGTIAAALFAFHYFLDTDPRFLIDSSASIQIQGNSEVTRPELLSVFGSDIGRNIFFVPLAERRAALEQLPWVEHATVMRILPDQLRVAITERTPVAFVRLGNHIELTDAHGVILTMPPATLAAMHYSFPVVTGINPGDPASIRAARMKVYQQFIAAINSGGERLSEELSEVDISDPEDVRALVPAAGSDILLHFGDDDFLARFHNYQAHLAEWRQQYPNLAAVDLRYERQVVLKMADGTVPGDNSQQAANPPAAIKPKAAAAPVHHARAAQAAPRHHPTRKHA
ncbi:MAG: FtsQ-type POTRA domain-containing protein [Acidobacteria bacterium]|nr:FtsQ-type POTRA domain-containing protein [Acidobacteriota bacterium]MBW4045279.1 FtsQ-type POTRA domain-containing protein [Acidobacteriota bacterium]